MNYASVCDGIGAAHVAWQPLGWRCAWTSEIDPFPIAVVERRWGFPNLGDMTAITEAACEQHGRIGLLVGGTPCQSFSVAGLRKGLADPRGNLTLRFVQLAETLRPDWIVWENVPGILSIDGGSTFRDFLDALEDIGFIIDVDILDAQFFGLAQRRRRVFVCGQHVESLLRQRTISSALTIAQCLSEVCHAILTGHQQRSESGHPSCDAPSLSENGLRRRIRLFGLHEPSRWPSLLDNLDALFQKSAREDCDSAFGGAGPATTATSTAAESSDSSESTGDARAPSMSIERSWRKALGDLFRLTTSFTTSTPTSGTTESAIFTCAKTALSIAESICRSNDSSPCYWSAASSALTALEAFTNYARSTTSNLFADMEWVQTWGDFLGQAEPAIVALRNIRVRPYRGSLLPLANSLSGHPAPRRETGQRVASALTRGLGSGGADAARTQANWMIPGNVPPVCPAIKARDSKGPSSDGDGDGDGAILVPMVAHSLRADGFDASEDGTGRGTPLVPVAVRTAQTSANGHGVSKDLAHTLDRANGQAIAFDCKATDAQPNTIAPTLRSMGHNQSHPNAGGQVAVAFGWQNSSQQGISASEHFSPTLDKSKTPAVAFDARNHAASSVAQTLQNCEGGGGRIHGAPLAATSAAVRRLTPRECERLQGFPTCTERVIIEACLDHQRHSVHVALRCLRWLNNASPVAGSESNGYAESAASGSPNDRDASESLAAVHVRSSHGDTLLAVRNLGRLRWSANGAANAGWFLPHTAPGNIAHDIAVAARGLVASARSGRAASHPLTLRFTLPRTGSLRAEMFGLGSGDTASSAAFEPGTVMKFITSSRGQSTHSSDSTEATWLCSVATAMTSCIPTGIARGSFSKFTLDIESDYTAVTYRKKPAADGPRYKALGNSMAVPVMRWIGERIARVEAVSSNVEKKSA